MRASWRDGRRAAPALSTAAARTARFFSPNSPSGHGPGRVSVVVLVDDLRGQAVE